MTDDLFANEQEILDKSLSHEDCMKCERFSQMVVAYKALLKQLRLSTKMADRTTRKLNDLHNMTEEQNKIITDRNSHLNREITKYELANRALGSGLWDIPEIDYEPDNLDTGFIYSDRVRQMLGYTDENDFPNIARSLIGSIHPDERKLIEDSFYDHLKDTTGQTPFDAECRVKDKEGEYRWYRIIGEAVRDDAGTPLQITGLLIDIDKHKQLEILQLKEQEQAFAIILREEQLKTVTAMAVTANHEINQHLIVMTMAFDLIKTKQDFDTMNDRDKKYWAKIEKGIKSIADLLTKYRTQTNSVEFKSYLDNIDMITFGEGE